MKILFRILIQVFIIIFSIGAAIGQTTVVEGVVVNSKEQPVQAKIWIKSSKSIVETDARGWFKILCKPKDKIKVSAKGYANSTVKIRGPKTIHIKLKKSGIDYSEYANFKEILNNLFGGNVSCVNNKIYMDKRDRGQASEALLILDGKEVNASVLYNLPCSQIETIKLLRDQETLIYGSRGSDGVIVVKTNKNQIN